MASWNIAVVGANGQIGRALIEQLQNSELSIDNAYFIGSDNSEGDVVRFSGKNISIKHIDKMNWSDCHLAFFVATQDVSLKYARLVAESGCVVIDATDAFALNDAIPLVVPKVNDFVLAEYRNENIIAVANPLVTQALRTINALTDIEQLSQLQITNLLSASLYGKKGVNELAGQSARLLNGLPVEKNIFDQQLAFNLLPSNLVDDHTIVEQIRRITGNYQLLITIQSSLIPIFYGLSQSISLTSAVPLYIEQNMQELEQKGIHLSLQDHQKNYPTPVTIINQDNDVTEASSIQVADLRYSYGNPDQIQFISISDNIRYLGAQILIETAEILLANYL